MMFRFPARKHNSVFAALLVFAGFAFYLFSYAHPAKPFSEEQLIRDKIWLDAWAIMLYVMLVLLWQAKLRWRVKAPLCVGCFSLYGFVTLALILNGTPFSWNAYWGDQQFRQAMILHFSSFAVPGDFYYKGLPPFYPPVYYFLLSLYSRLFSLEAYKMLKIGSMLIYLVGPSLLYIVWRRLVAPFQAFLITLATYLFCSLQIAHPIAVPHAFLADSFFIPWWLYYIERVKNPPSNWRYFVLGGLLGGIIFCTYFYSFLIGGVLLILRLTLLAKWQLLKKLTHFDAKKATGVLLCAAIVSAPYWLPLLFSIFEYGIDRSRGGWHHIGNTGIVLEYLKFSWPGVLFFAGIAHALRRYRSPLYGGLVLLVGTVLIYLLIGSVLGAFDKPINLVKSRQFLAIAAGPFIGLSLAAVIRREQVHRRSRPFVAILASLLMLVFLNEFNDTAKQKRIQTARTAVVPTWDTDAEQMKQRKGAVFLTEYQKLPCFYPVYCFFISNEHYSHPASRYGQRYEFLYLLQNVNDPYLFNLALRYNKYDRVDYFMLPKKDGHYKLTALLSNYPNKYCTKILQYDQSVVSDSLLFKKEVGKNLFSVRALSTPPDSARFTLDSLSRRDSLLFLGRLLLIRKSLDDSGIQLLDHYTAADWKSWHDLATSAEEADFGRSIDLRALYAVETADSIYFVSAFRIKSDLHNDYKIFLHLYPANAGGRFENFDFVPRRRTSTWEKGDIVFCYRPVPRAYEEMRLHIGFFRGKKRTGEGYWGTLNLSYKDQQITLK